MKGVVAGVVNFPSNTINWLFSDVIDGAQQMWGVDISVPKVMETEGWSGAVGEAVGTALTGSALGELSSAKTPPSGTSTTAVTPFYPANNGFSGTAQTAYLFPGQTIQRYGGSNYSRFFAPQGTPAGALALPPGTAQQPLNLFQVVKPFPVQSGTVAPAFGQLGGGTQYVTPVNLGTLLKRGVIVRK